MLRHDMLNGIGPVFQMPIHILIFIGPGIFKAFQNIQLILGSHLIHLTGFHCIRKLLVIREPSTFTLCQKRKLELLQIIGFCSIVTHDFLM